MKARFNPLDYPIALTSPLRLTDVSSWRQHIPFAFALVDMIRPRTFVELGVFRGDSFCAVCQAVSALRLPTTCVGIDTWHGDIHIGEYDDSVYLDIAAYVEEHYASFASPMRRTFDEAAGEFKESSIDLLHIDGTHTYEAVRHDVDTWLSKMSERGVIVMHDVCEHQAEFGVYRVWDELQQRYPTSTFMYGHGLGVAAVGAEAPQRVLDLIEEMQADPTVAQYFHVLGERVRRMTEDNGVARDLERQAKATQEQLGAVTAQRDTLEAERADWETQAR